MIVRSRSLCQTLSWMLFCAFSSLVASNAGSASPLLTDEALARIEKEFRAAIKQHQPDPDRLFHLHLIAARELRAHGFQSKSREYYRKALEIRTAEPKAEPAIELFHHELREFLRTEKPTAVRPSLETALKHVTDPQTRTYLKEMASGFLDSTGPSAMLSQGLASHPLLWQRLRQFMSEKKYPEALAMLERQSLEHANIKEQIIYDLLAVLVSGRRAGPLLCEPSLGQFPDAYSASIKACRLLAHYRDTGTKDPEQLRDLELFRTREGHPERTLLEAVGDLK